MFDPQYPRWGAATAVLVSASHLPQPKGEAVSEPEHDEETELVEPTVTDVPEPDQEPGEEEAEAEAEAERAESPEAEVEPEAQGPTQEEWERRFTKAEARFKTYTRAVSDIWAEDAVHLVAFSLDPAAPAGFIDMRNKGHVEEETKQAALTFLGFDVETGVRDDPYSDVCATCDGWGVVKTGSKVPNQDVRTCDDCKGLGFLPHNAVGIGPVSVEANGANAPNVNYVPNKSGPESPEIEALRLRGYTIVPPMQTGAP